MYTKWTSHISDPEEKTRFQNQIISAKPVLERLAQLVSEDESQLDKVQLSVKQFENPNWEVKTAYYFGSRAYMDTVKKLIDLDQQDIPNDRKLTRYPVNPTNG